MRCQGWTWRSRDAACRSRPAAAAGTAATCPASPPCRHPPPPQRPRRLPLMCGPRQSSGHAHQCLVRSNGLVLNFGWMSNMLSLRKLLPFGPSYSAVEPVSCLLRCTEPVACKKSKMARCYCSNCTRPTAHTPAQACPLHPLCPYITVSALCCASYKFGSSFSWTKIC